ncbi:hypothetical protein ACN47E_006117 [Coniothyrium glycines]
MWEDELADKTADEADEQFNPQAPETGFEDLRAWLDMLCQDEKDRCLLVEQEKEEKQVEDTVGPKCAATFFTDVQLGMDTSFLGRIRHRQENSVFVPEDLLAPLRRGEATTGELETYEEMTDVLYRWNAHVSNPTDQSVERLLLLEALRERLKAAERVLQIVRDEKEAEIYDEVGHQGILEPSANRLLQAMHKYRPETREFRHQDPFDMLTLLWANMQVECPDVEGDEEIMYFTFRVLNTEKYLAQRFENEEKRRKICRRIDAARRNRNRAELVYQKDELLRESKRVSRELVQANLDTIQLARSRLMAIVLDELLDLTVLQAAQNLERHGCSNLTLHAPWSELLEACADADIELERELLGNMDGLELSSAVAASRIHEMRTKHDAAYTRALKFAGLDLASLDAAGRMHMIELRKNEPTTALLMSQTLDSVCESRQVAQQVVRQAEAVESTMGVLLTAATAQHQGYEKVLRLLESTGCVGEGGVRVEDEEGLADCMY